MDVDNFIHLYNLEVGDIVLSPNNDDISDYLTKNSPYRVIDIPVGSLSIFYILDDNDTELACLYGQPDIHLNGQLWKKVKLNNLEYEY